MEPFLGLGRSELAQTGAFGPSAYYFLGYWLEALAKDREDPSPVLDKAAELYALGLDKDRGFGRREAGKALIRLRLAQARAAGLDSAKARSGWEALLEASRAAETALGLEPRILLPRVEALTSLGRHAEALRELELAPPASPDSPDAAAEMDYYRALIALELGKSEAGELLESLLRGPLHGQGGRVLDLARKAAAKNHPPPSDSVARFELRETVSKRDYRGALAILRLQPDLGSEPSLIADAAKAYLFGGAATEGLAFCDGIAKAAAADGLSHEDSRAVWTALFYKGRLLRAQEKWTAAADLFETLSPSAPSEADTDAALWYALDSRFKELRNGQANRHRGLREDMRALLVRRELLAELAAAAPRWHKAAQFSDLAEPLLREAIRARDWAFVVEFAEALADRLLPSLGARSLYVGARARQLGYIKEGAEQDREAFIRVLRLPGSPAYYRLLASLQLSEESQLLPPDLPANGRRDITELETFFVGFAEFGAPALGFQAARPWFGEMDREGLRALAESLSKAGSPSESMRTVVALMAREDWDPRLRDYELLYPRPFLAEFRSIRPRPPAPEYVLYGLVRSESFFRKDVVSSAGAVGLSQLMPATAAETARKLGLADFELTRPSDNLRIGFHYFTELLKLSDGRALRAMFAYNAGRGRLRTWLSESGDLPDDLLLESLGIEETRGYGRNILEAAAFYGELYYGKSSLEVMREILDGLQLEER